MNSISRIAVLCGVIVLASCQVRETAPDPEPVSPAPAGLPAVPVAAGPTLPPGPVTVIEVSLSGHAPSAAAQAETARLARDAGPLGLRVMGWVVDGPVAADAGYPQSVVNRTQLAVLGEVRVLPSRVLVDRTGRVRKVFPGVAWSDDAQAEMEAVLAEVEK